MNQELERAILESLRWAFRVIDNYVDPSFQFAPVDLAAGKSKISEIIELLESA